MTKNERKYSAYLCSQCDISTVSAKGETCKECRAASLIRVRNLPTRCTEEVEDSTSTWEGDHSITVGRTYIEGTAEDLRDVAQQLLEKEVWFDYNGQSDALYKQCVKTAEAARVRWADKIERAANSRSTMRERAERIMKRRSRKATTDLVEGCPDLEAEISKLF